MRATVYTTEVVRDHWEETDNSACEETALGPSRDQAIEAHMKMHLLHAEKTALEGITDENIQSFLRRIMKNTKTREPNLLDIEAVKAIMQVMSLANMMVLLKLF